MVRMPTSECSRGEAEVVRMVRGPTSECTRGEAEVVRKVRVPTSECTRGEAEVVRMVAARMVRVPSSILLPHVSNVTMKLKSSPMII